jgi:TPR repeat protein
MSGDGVPKDFRQAEYWYRKAAEQGDAKATFALEIYFNN